MAYKEKDTKKWTAQWFETTAKGEKKKRRKRGFDTKRDALEYERQKKLNSKKSMDMKLNEFMEVYFEDKQNELKERTIKNKKYMMEQHISPYFGDLMMSEITASQIVKWQNEMQTKGFSESYLRMIQNQLTELLILAPKVETGDDFARVKIYWFGKLTDWSREDKIRTCYLATCYNYVNEISVSNAVLRERFEVEEKNMSIVSRIIKMTLDAGLIKLADENASLKNRRYVPYWT